MYRLLPALEHLERGICGGEVGSAELQQTGKSILQDIMKHDARVTIGNA